MGDLDGAAAALEFEQWNSDQALLISSGGLTKLLKRLEAAGLIERPENPEDGRSQLVQLRPEGARLAEAAMTKLCDLQATWLAPLNEEQRGQLDQLLELLEQFLE